MAHDDNQNVYPLRSAREMRREASEWIARMNADHVSAEDHALFKAWRGANAHHVRAFEEVSGTWTQLNHTGELVRAVTSGQAFADSTQRAIRRSLSSTRRRKVFAIAAMFVMAAMVAWYFVEPFAQRTVFQTAIGEQARVELPDGSMLELNSNSRARVEYSTLTRVVWLERGEAFFKVERQTQRPFWVVAGHSWVGAVGTAFNVRIRPGGSLVTVSEGAVKVAGRPPSLSAPPSDARLSTMSMAVLKAGQQVSVTDGESAVRSLEPLELDRSVAWRTGTIYFKREPLSVVVEEMNRYTARRIVITDESLRDLDIGGTFETNAQGGEALLTTLEDGFDLKVRREGGAAYIER